MQELERLELKGQSSEIDAKKVSMPLGYGKFDCITDVWCF